MLKQSLNQTDSAHALAIEALNNIPNDHSIHFLMANILGEERKFSMAEFHFKTAIDLNPDNAIYYNNLAVLYHREKLYKLAIQYYNKTIQLNPKHSSALKNLKILLKKK